MITASAGSCPSPSEQSAVQISSLLSCQTERTQVSTIQWPLNCWVVVLPAQRASSGPPNLPSLCRVLGPDGDQESVLQDSVGQGSVKEKSTLLSHQSTRPLIIPDTLHNAWGSKQPATKKLIDSWLFENHSKAAERANTETTWQKLISSVWNNQDEISLMAF